MKKSFYNSSDVLTLLTLKSGLKNWRRKIFKNDNINNSGMYKNILNMSKGHNPV
jgi:hypothetical protein